MIEAVGRSIRAIFEVVREFSKWSRNYIFLPWNFLCSPVPNFAFTFVVDCFGETGQESVSDLSLAHLENEVLREINGRIVVALFVDVIRAVLDDSCVPVEQVLHLILRDKRVSDFREGCQSLRSPQPLQGLLVFHACRSQLFL